MGATWSCGLEHRGQASLSCLLCLRLLGLEDVLRRGRVIEGRRRGRLLRRNEGCPRESVPHIAFATSVTRTGRRGRRSQRTCQRRPPAPTTRNIIETEIFSSASIYEAFLSSFSSSSPSLCFL